MDDTSPNLASAVSTTTGSRTIWTSKSRVAKVLKRLMRKNSSDFPKSETESYNRLDDEKPENKYNVSQVDRVGYNDNYSSWEGGKSTGKQHIEENRNLKQPKHKQLHPTLSNSTDASFSQCIGAWFDSLSCLAKSKEMDSFLDSSNKLALSAACTSLERARNVGEIAVSVALLPVTLPLQVTASATGLVFNKGSSALHYFCDNLVPIVVNHSIKVPAKHMIVKAVEVDTHTRLRKDAISKAKTNTYESTNAKSRIHELENWQFNYDPEIFLDRLRLDSTSERNDIEDVSRAIYPVDTEKHSVELKASISCSYNCSKFLLRVDDVNINVKQDLDLDSNVRVFCVDLENDNPDKDLTLNALTQLAQRGIDICLSNGSLLNILQQTNQKQIGTVNRIQIDWKPLGQTKKDYRRLEKLPKDKYFDELCGGVYMWTGKYLGDKYHGSENPFFMAQGCVNGSPTKILNLLWDSKRTNEYNKHCVNREDILSVVDDTKVAMNRAFWGAKIIKSETKVPFVNISVHICALMCAKLLGVQPKDGFIIFSRSLSCGHKGYHSSKSKGLCQSSSNEVILGINILRPVPEHPGLTDLISISQVDSRILPQFLKARVGTMAVEDFFKNIRLALK